MSRWERGEHEPLGDRLDSIAAVLETTTADLMAGAMVDRPPKAPAPDLGQVLGDQPTELQELHDAVEANAERIDAIAQMLEQEIAASADMRQRLGDFLDAQERSASGG